MRTLACVSLPVLLLVSGAALAHPGHDFGGSGFVAGLLHPLLGLDHLLALLMVGIWAAQLGGRAVLAVPASFIGVMVLGAALAFNGWVLPLVDAGIAASLLVLGLLVAAAGRLSVTLAACVAGIFALFHGSAHGVELPEMAQPWAYGLGFVTATAALHGAGGGVGLFAAPRWNLAARSTGALSAIWGATLLLGPG